MKQDSGSKLTNVVPGMSVMHKGGGPTMTIDVHDIELSKHGTGAVACWWYAEGGFYQRATFRIDQLVEVMPKS